MSPPVAVRIERVSRRRGAFGLDDRRRPDPARIEAEILAHLRERLPEVWAQTSPGEPEPAGRTIVLLLPRGHAAVLRVERDRDAPGPVALALAERCRHRAIPCAVVSSLAGARAALRRFGIEPRPCPPTIPFPRSVGRCRARTEA